MNLKYYAEELSKKIGEPEWARRLRLKAAEAFEKLPEPPWMKGLDYEEIASKVLEGTEKGVVEIPDWYEKLLKDNQLFEIEKAYLSGATVMVNNDVVYKAQKKDLERRGVVLTSMREAIKKYDILKDYFMKAIELKTKNEALHYALWADGTFLYVPKNVKVPYPVQAFFLLTEVGITQSEHSITIVDEGGSIHYIEGCVLPVKLATGIHLGGSEFYVKRGGKLRVSSLQNWAGNVRHVPVKGGIVEEGGELNELSLELGGSLVAVRPHIRIVGKNAKASVNGLAIIKGETRVWSGSTVEHLAPHTKSYVNNRSVIRDKGWEEFKGEIIIRRGAKYSSGYQSCNTLLLSDEAINITIPMLVSEEKEVDLSHEGNVGRFSEDKLVYLRMMGFDEHEALQILALGFIDPMIQDLPPDYVRAVREIVKLTIGAA